MADAVILVTYQLTSAATPNAAHRASGVAIRYSRAGGGCAAGRCSSAASRDSCAGSRSRARDHAAAPAAGRSRAASRLVQARTGSGCGSCCGSCHARLRAGQVLLTEGDLVGRRYVHIGPVSVTVHQKSMFTKVSEMEQTQTALRAAAHAKGADAVIR